MKLSFDIKTKFDMSNTDSFNVIAEIPGTTKPNELVMVGGHFDSWHMGTGATDNGAGSAVAMEVMRILKSLNLKMDRTVRMALWGGEEEGLLGSRAYVKEHLPIPTTMKTTAEHDGFAGYFNIDNGTGRVRGIYLQGNEMVRPIFEQWFAALKDVTPGVITVRNTGGTDHQSYDRGGLARVPVHPGPHGLRNPHAPFEHGRVRSHPAGRHGTDRGGGSRLRVQRGHPTRETPAQGSASAHASGRPRRSWKGRGRTRQSIAQSGLTAAGARMEAWTGRKLLPAAEPLSLRRSRSPG